MYTRFDSVHLDPASMALVFGRDEAVAASTGQTCLDFELYNNTGAGISGHHYDPILPSAVVSPTAVHGNPLLRPQKKKKAEQKKTESACSTVVGPPSHVAPHDNPLLGPSKRRKQVTVAAPDVRLSTNANPMAEQIHTAV